MQNVTFPLSGVVYPAEADAVHYLDCGAWLDMSAGQALRLAAERAPHKCALVSQATRLTYAEFDSRSERLGAALLGLGLRPGERVLFQMGSVAETAITLFACAKAGLIPVCTLPQHRAVEIGELARRSEARAYFVQADFSNFDLISFAKDMAARFAIEHVIVARAATRSHGDVRYFEDLVESQQHAQALARLQGLGIGCGDVMIFQLSGGTTNVPKIIPRFHGEFLGQAKAWAQRTAMGQSPVSLYALPLIHNAGLVAMLYPTILKCGTTVLMQRMDPRLFFELVEQERVTHSLSIGPAAMRLLEYDDIGRHDRSSLRLLTNFDGSEAMERQIRAPCANIYGITEGFIMSPAPDSPPAMRFETVGWPVSDQDETRIVVPGTEEDAAPGEVGEFCFRGPSSIRGYYRMPEVNRSSFTVDGFFRTGDLLRSRRLDDRTCYAFQGRTKDNISRGGEKFGAEEVEYFITKHPDVVDAKVVAMPDRVYGERACAFIIARAGAAALSVADLGAFLSEQGLAKFKLPERVEIIDTFPITGAGKTDKAALRKLIAEKRRAEEDGLPGAANRSA